MPRSVLDVLEDCIDGTPLCVQLNCTEKVLFKKVKGVREWYAQYKNLRIYKNADGSYQCLNLTTMRSYYPQKSLRITQTVLAPQNDA